jgi:DNA-directed RNA polymerase specialized sigma subunit
MNLPEKDWLLSKSVYWEGRTQEYVAWRNGISKQDVNQHKNRILRGLRHRI